VDTIIPYLAVRGNHTGPIFILPNGRMLTRDAFRSALDNILVKLNLQASQYNTYSFRISAATFA